MIARYPEVLMVKMKEFIVPASVKVDAKLKDQLIAQTGWAHGDKTSVVRVYESTPALKRRVVTDRVRLTVEYIL